MPNTIPSDALNGMQLPDLPEMPGLQIEDFQSLDLSPDLSKLNQSISIDQLESIKDIQDKIGNVSDNLSKITELTKDTGATEASRWH